MVLLDLDLPLEVLLLHATENLRQLDGGKHGIVVLVYCLLELALLLANNVAQVALVLCLHDLVVLLLA
jgi:hypothetical protein